MSLENGKCENCGGTLALDSGKDKAVCKYCGSEIIIVQALSRCRMDGIVSFDALLVAAQQAIELDGDHDKARSKYKEALALRPEDYRAYWGLFLCEVESILWYKRLKGFVQFPGDIRRNLENAVQRYGKRAHAFAPDDTKPYYEEKINEAMAQ